MAEPTRQPASTSRRHALVLGWKGSAERIARSLGTAGFTTVLETELPPTQRLQRPSPPGAIEAAREALKRCAAAAPNDATLFLHPCVSTWSERPVLQTLGQEL